MFLGIDPMQAGAEFSPCRRYRLTLRRRWDSAPQVLFGLLNPSTADESRDDPTVRRCIGLARSWGYGALAIGNLFAFRTIPCSAPVRERCTRWGL